MIQCQTISQAILLIRVKYMIYLVPVLNANICICIRTFAKCSYAEKYRHHTNCMTRYRELSYYSNTFTIYEQFGENITQSL